MALYVHFHCGDMGVQPATHSKVLCPSFAAARLQLGVWQDALPTGHQYITERMPLGVPPPSVPSLPLLSPRSQNVSCVLLRPQVPGNAVNVL